MSSQVRSLFLLASSAHINRFLDLPQITTRTTIAQTTERTTAHPIPQIAADEKSVKEDTEWLPSKPMH